MTSPHRTRLAGHWPIMMTIIDHTIDIPFDPPLSLRVRHVHRREDQLVREPYAPSHPLACHEGPWPDLPQRPDPCRQRWQGRRGRRQGAHGAMHREPRQRAQGRRLFLGAGRQGQRVPQEHGRLCGDERGLREAPAHPQTCAHLHLCAASPERCRCRD